MSDDIRECWDINSKGLFLPETCINEGSWMKYFSQGVPKEKDYIHSMPGSSRICQRASGNSRMYAAQQISDYQKLLWTNHFIIQWKWLQKFLVISLKSSSSTSFFLWNCNTFEWFHHSLKFLDNGYFIRHLILKHRSFWTPQDFTTFMMKGWWNPAKDFQAWCNIFL